MRPATYGRPLRPPVIGGKPTIKTPAVIRQGGYAENDVNAPNPIGGGARGGGNFEPAPDSGGSE